MSDIFEHIVVIEIEKCKDKTYKQCIEETIQKIISAGIKVKKPIFNE